MNTALDNIIRASTWAGDAVFAALSWMGPGAALWVLSAALGVLMMVIWRFTSNQRAIADVRRRISADLLATKLFKDNLAVTFRSQRRILWQAVRLLGYSIKPMAIMMVPFVLVMVQIGLRYERRPAPMERALRVTATVKPGRPFMSREVQAEATRIVLPPGLRHNPQDPCRAEMLGTVDWRLTAVAPGTHVVELGSAEHPIRVPLVFGDGFERISSVTGGAWHERLLYSAEPSIPEASVIGAVRVDYPRRRTPMLGFDVHWLVSLFVLSIVFALLVKPLLKVHI